MSETVQDSFREGLQSELQEIRDAGLWKSERVITTPQGADVRVKTGEEVLNFCANNYLGLSDDPAVVDAARKSLDTHGFGMSSVRFICGTQDIHKELEAKISDFLGFEETILYTSCFDANGGLFETLLTADDAVISDELNHASIIDGVRLCKAKRFRYKNSDMEDLERCLREADDAGARRKLISTDGVFSMDGFVAKLDEICDLADRYDAWVHVDDSHSTGFMGKTGRGTHEHCDVMGRVNIITSTLGKALGGASGGYTSASKEVVDMLRNRSRPYLFSNSVAPPIVAASIAVFDRLSATTELRDRLEENTAFFREQMTDAGFQIQPGVHPIVPIMLGDARLAAEMADDLLAEGIYVIGFSFPVVPKGKARIRVQISAAHTRNHLNRAIAAFIQVGKARGVLG
ncbi:MAG: glycine C-acetyltransferase [Planctomycetes bacterium]|jgi:glycine C-acetyltransferase|nr:glycine C-acetyltransferase [Planctomycetota bacterium]MDP7245812.1 glycine C-acetyltransferase [Planctomycetota bacterium]|tara:strand:- start:837 stop:2045 length:1209 start_codon:yes stop_codon:yes gene_type:complete